MPRNYQNKICVILSVNLLRKADSSERSCFLEDLKNFCKQDGSDSKSIENDIIDRIHRLKDEIMERHESIDDGTFYDDYDEDPDSISDMQKEELENLFSEIDHLFFSNELFFAKEAYKLILDWFRDDVKNDFYYSLFDSYLNINWRETRSRYCRCVYETTSGKKRISAMVHAMEVNKNMFEIRYAPLEEKYPLLKDVFEARPGELVDWDKFLKDWQNALKKNTNNRAVILYLEAIHQLEGMKGLIEKVKTRKLPVAYLYWLDQLALEQKCSNSETKNKNLKVK